MNIKKNIWHIRVLCGHGDIRLRPIKLVLVRAAGWIRVRRGRVELVKRELRDP